MKIKTICFFVFMFLCFWFISADDEFDTVNTYVPFVNSNHLDSLSFYFCDDGFDDIKPNQDIFLRPWQKKEICLLFVNSSEDYEMPLSVWFVDADIWSDWKFICSNDNNTWMFFNLLKLNQEDFDMILNPWQKFIKKIIFEAPKNLTWEIYGCIWYFINKDLAKTADGLFTIVNRKVWLFKANISWDVYKWWFIDDIKFFVKNNQSILIKIFIFVVAVLLLQSLYSIFKSHKSKSKK